jgi:DNA (cytosine-5)-methyltransferase 1
MKPRLLDLFCGAGGAAVGYARAGFEVVGVDIKPQPHYPFEFHQADALTFPLDGFDVVHASPPCQAYSVMTASRPGLRETYPDLIPVTRIRLTESGLPYVIENVIGAPLLSPIVLCGSMFGRPLYRHRGFESAFDLRVPIHPKHQVPASKAGHWRPGTVISVAGNCAPIALARLAMGIDWTNRDELAEAIPPDYTEHIGSQLMAHLRSAAA